MANQNNGAMEVTREEVNLEQRIEALVEQKVAARFAQLEARVAQTLSQITRSAAPQSSNRATLFVSISDNDEYRIFSRDPPVTFHSLYSFRSGV